MADKDTTASGKPRGVSDEDWTTAQQQAAQQGMSPEDYLAKQKDPMHGLIPEEKKTTTRTETTAKAEEDKE